MEPASPNPKHYIFLRNIIRDRTCGSVEELRSKGGVQGIARQLDVTSTQGVSASDVERRRTEYGTNAPPPTESTGYFEFLFEAFSDFTVLMLVAAAIVSLVLAFAYEKTAGSYAEGFAILLSVVIVTNVTATNDYSKQKQFQKLNAAVEDTSVRCVRDGHVLDVKSADLVAGDIVQLAVGDIFPADGLLIQGDGVSTDESALTGEPKLIRKDPGTSPFLLSGTKVMEGSGLYIIIAVGVNSEAGQIRELIRNKKKQPKAAATATAADGPAHDQIGGDEGEDGEEKSVLTAKLDRIAILIGKGATVIAVIALIVMCVRYAVEHFALTDASRVCVRIAGEACSSSEARSFAPNTTAGFPLCIDAGLSRPCCQDISDGSEIIGSPCPWLKNHLGEFLQFLITAITILVVAVPEGLPLAVTLSLAFSVRKMQSQNNLVKHLDACETMGSATTICSDKTGTLTKNRMTVVRSMIGSNKTLSFQSQALPLGVKEMLIESICLSGAADIEWNEQLHLWDQIGSKTECALLQTIKDDLKHSKTYKEVRAELQSRIVKKFPFSSAAKKSSVLVKVPDSTSLRLYTIGASEIVLEACSSVVVDGVLTAPGRQAVEKTIEEYAKQAMRTVCIAYKEIPSFINAEAMTADEGGLTLLCLVGIEDPLRDEVPLAITKCNRAGVDVKMVTGDNLDTAIAIGTRCNIIRASDMDPTTGGLKPNVAMTGPDFRKAVLDENGNLIQASIDKIWPFLRVLARSSPTDKYTLVSGMLASKLNIVGGDRQVVAVTGDGTNDAPALKKADVGFAMGITGTAVARDAADIILLDDNFASIVVACMWGRNVFDSIQKFLQFQLTVNVVAVTIAIEGAFINNESPIGAVQMLWVNLIMDALASLALATEPPTEALLERPPHGRSESAISSIMIWNIVGHATFQLLILNGIFFGGPSWLDIPSGVGRGHGAPPSLHYTMMFNALVVMQLTNQINSRSLYHEFNVFKGLTSNMFFVVILAIETILQVIFVEFGGTWVSCLKLPGWLWGVSIAISFGSFPVQWAIIAVRRFVHRVKPPLPPKSAPKLDKARAAGSVLSPLPPSRVVRPAFIDPEVGGRFGVTQSAENLGQLSKHNSGALRAFSTKNLKDLVGAPGVSELTRTASGGFKNPRRQTAANQRFKKMSSFGDAMPGTDATRAQFTQAALEYQKKTTSPGPK